MRVPYHIWWRKLTFRSHKDMRLIIDDAKMTRCRSSFFNASSIVGGYGVDFESAIPYLVGRLK